jgi:hypothetical protein
MHSFTGLRHADMKLPCTAPTVGCRKEVSQMVSGYIEHGIKDSGNIVESHALDSQNFKAAYILH